MAQDTEATANQEAPARATAPEEVPGTPEERGAHAHPTEVQYIKVALVLAVVTLAEVLVYYVESLEDFLVPILIVFSTIKFVLVVLWFMHLRFDSRLFRRLFVAGLVLALGVYAIVLSTFHVWTR